VALTRCDRFVSWRRRQRARRGRSPRQPVCPRAKQLLVLPHPFHPAPSWRRLSVSWRSPPTFRRNAQPLCSGIKSNPSNHQEASNISDGSHSILAGQLSRLSSCSTFLARSSALKMEAVRSSETEINVYQTARRHVSKSLLYFFSVCVRLFASSKCLFVALPASFRTNPSSICFEIDSFLFSVSLFCFPDLHNIPSTVSFFAVCFML
jgi:hypothetical protein